MLTGLQNRFRADLLWCGINDDAPSYFAVSANYPNLDVWDELYKNRSSGENWFSVREKVFGKSYSLENIL